MRYRPDALQHDHHAVAQLVRGPAVVAHGVADRIEPGRHEVQRDQDDRGRGDADQPDKRGSHQADPFRRGPHTLHHADEDRCTRTLKGHSRTLAHTAAWSR